MYHITEILLACQQLKLLYEKMITEVAKKHNLGRMEVDVLLFLWNNPTLDSAKDIVEIRQIAKSYVSKTVESLVEKELLTAAADKEDRRKIHLEVNKNAEKIVKEARQTQNKYLKIIYKDVTKEEKETLKKIMEKMVYNVKEELL